MRLLVITSVCIRIFNDIYACQNNEELSYKSDDNNTISLLKQKNFYFNINTNNYYQSDCNFFFRVLFSP